MKTCVGCLVLLSAIFIRPAQASPPPAVPASAGIHQVDCRKSSDQWASGSTSLRVTVVSCPDGKHIVVERKDSNGPVVTRSKDFMVPYAGVGNVEVFDHDSFDVGFLEARHYTHPSTVDYRFHFQGDKWLLVEMSFQATQACDGEAGVDSDYYDIDYLTGKVTEKLYDDCHHYKTRQLTVKPATIPLDGFDTSDDRLAPFRYD